MAKFAILIYAPDTADWATAPDDELEAHGAFGSIVTEQGGTEVSGYALSPTTAAKSAAGDKVSDGPAVNGGLALGGFGIFEARDIEHAISIAKHNPATWRGAVEVRPLFGDQAEA